jgi:two-component system, cell cycle sensor histidine kinase and response regulator CckA
VNVIHSAPTCQGHPISATPLRLLILEDNPSDAELALHALRRAGYNPTAARVETEQDFRDNLTPALEVILADFSLPGFDAVRALEIVHDSGLDIPLIIVSGTIGEERAVDVMRRGASDYIIKDRLGRLGQAVAHVLDKKARRDETRLAERRLSAQHAATRLLAESRDLDVAVPRILEAVCASMGWVWAAAWMAAPQAGCLKLGPFWHAPSADAGGFLAACREKTFLLGEGLPGRVWMTGEPLWVADVMQDEGFCGKHAATGAGLHSAFAFPILFGSEVVGVIEFLSRQIEHPDEKILGMMAAVGSQVGQFIERNRKEELLRKSEERFQELTAHVHQVLWIMDVQEAKVLYVSPGYEKLWGRTCQSLLDNPQAYLEGIHPLDREFMDGESAAMFQTGFIDVECRVLRPDESVRWVWVRGYPISEQGRLVRVAGVIEDITEKRLMAAERDALLDRLQLHIERMPLAYVLFDDNIRVCDWNPAAERIFGYSKREALGMRPVDFIPAAFRGKAEELLGRIQSGDRYAHSVNENLTKDGRTLICEWMNTPIIEHDGRFAGMLCLAQDVTERQRLKEQYSQAQQRLKHVMASSPAVLFTLSIGVDQIEGVSWISENLVEMTGYAAETALSPDWWQEKVHPDDLERVLAQVNAELLSQGRTNHEYRFRHKDGSYRWTRGDLRLVRDAAGQPLEVVGSWSDVTERKDLEDQFRQAQKMEAFGQLAGGVAHDFNNLLTIISGYSDMLLESPRLDHRSRGLVQEVHTAGARAALLTGQLLAFSRRQVVQPRAIDLNALVAGTEKMLGRLIGEDVILATVPQPGLDRVQADAGQLEQVILNLVVNARDAMPRGGRITLETANVHFKEVYGHGDARIEPGRYVRLSVTDTGSGMTEAVKARIFEPFFTTKAQGKGTGLGLATVFGIVKQSGGHVRVSSEVGRGTTFEIYLSAIAEVAALPPLPAHSGPIPSGTETILVVEDEAPLRSMTRLALEKNGYTVLEAGDGEEAIRVGALHLGPIQLLVSDVVMPRMGGRQLAERLTALRPEMRVMFVSGYTDDAVVRNGVRQAEVAFLQKPFSPDALSRKVRTVLDGAGVNRSADVSR